MARLIRLAPALLGMALLLGTASTAEAQFDMEAALAGGSWAWVLAVSFITGLLMSATPCVWPMMIITVSVFGARESKSIAHGAFLSTMYLLGICALFVPLGVTAGWTGGMFGAFMASPWLMFPLAAFFITLSASMFGAFELNLPPALQNKLASVGGVGPGGAFLVGLVSGLVAAPCTGPGTLALMGYIGTTGDATLGAFAFLALSIGLGLPTWLVGTFAVSMPKSGRWLEMTKSLFGVVLVGVAIFFIRDWVVNQWVAGALGVEEVVRRTSAHLTGATALLVAGLALGAVHLSYHGASWLVAVRKTSGIALATVGGLGLALWVLAPPELPPGAELEWVDGSYEEARELAQTEGKPLLVDFGAEWCLACNELERETFSDPRVVREGQRFVAVRVDMTGGEELRRGRELLATYSQQGLPLVVMHDSDGTEQARVVEFVEAEHMLQLMRTVQ